MENAVLLSSPGNLFKRLGFEQSIMEDILKQIKKAITEVAQRHGIEIDKIILFGSRARGDSREESDWDVLIITKHENKDTSKFLKDIKIKLSIEMKIPNDLIIVSKKYYEEKKGDVGSIGYHAEAEGIVI